MPRAQSKPTKSDILVLKKSPTRRDGTDGDIVLSTLRTGPRLYAKLNDKWHGIPIGDSFERIVNDKIEDLSRKLSDVPDVSSLPEIERYLKTALNKIDRNLTLTNNEDNATVLTVASNIEGQYSEELEACSTLSLYKNSRKFSVSSPASGSRNGQILFESANEDIYSSDGTLPYRQIDARIYSETTSLDAIGDNSCKMVFGTNPGISTTVVVNGSHSPGDTTIACDSNALLRVGYVVDPDGTYFPRGTTITALNVFGATTIFTTSNMNTLTIGDDAVINITNNTVVDWMTLTNSGTLEVRSLEVSDELKLVYNSLNYATITTGVNGATTIETVDYNSTSGNIILKADGNIVFKGGAAGGTDIGEFNADDSGTLLLYGPAILTGGLQIASTSKLYLTASLDTYIEEDPNDGIKFNVGGTHLVQFTENATQASQIVELKDDCNLKVGGSAYFDAQTHQDITSGGIAVDWNVGNKQSIDVTGTGYTLTMTNPAGPCNLLLKVIQGDGSDTITTWAASSGSVYWAGGAIPTLSTGNGEIDIVSFYFDGTNYFAIATHNFETV